MLQACETLCRKSYCMCRPLYHAGPVVSSMRSAPETKKRGRSREAEAELEAERGAVLALTCMLARVCAAMLCAPQPLMWM